MRKERLNEIWGVFFLLLGLFSLSSLLFFNPDDIAFYTSHPNSPVQNLTGITGAYLAFAMLTVFGISSLIIPAIFLLWSACFFLQNVPEKKLFKFIGLLIALFSTSSLVAISVDVTVRLEKGGVIGYLAGTHLLRYFGYAGSFILATSLLLLSLLLATDFLIYPLVKKFAGRMHESWEEVLVRLEGVRSWTEDQFIPKDKRGKSIPKPKSKQEASVSAAIERTLPEGPLKIKKYQPDSVENPDSEKIDDEKSESRKDKPAPKPVREVKPKLEKTGDVLSPAASGGDSKEGEKIHTGVISSKIFANGNYQFPSIDLLRKPQKETVKTDNLEGNSRILEDTLAEFGIEVKVVEVEQGPVITRYEILPAPGVKVNSIAALSDDLALALKAASIRLIIPIPGKSAIGVEVPNIVTSMVYLRELVESQIFRSKKYILPLAIGKDTSGKPLMADLTAMPHILIAGTTGSGKTVCVNSIITGLLYHMSPDDLKFVMVDPKMVELNVYNKIPHMLSPVVTDVKKAARTLNWVVNEMENRYRLFAGIGVRNIHAFNTRPLSEEALNELKNAPASDSVVPVKLPYIVVVIDELADLMMVAQDKVESAITRLAQLSRAVGIHLILATQRPSVDVITGVIKANFPARISFKVAAKVDSRTVLDTGGADKLLGKGDLLFIQPGDSKPVRGQAALVVDEEINAIVAFVSNQGKPEFHPEILSVQEGKSPQGGVMDKDELFDEAVAIVLETGQASTSNLQRRLRLGYTRAARIIDQMEAEGLIGSQQGAKPRDILMARDQHVSSSSDTNE